MPEYKKTLNTRERHIEFEDKLLKQASLIDHRLDTHLPKDVLEDVVIRMTSRIAAWSHSPIFQRERQKKQVAARRRECYGRDLQVVRLHENGMSQRKIAAALDMSRGAVRNVLDRDQPNLHKKPEIDAG